MMLFPTPVLAYTVADAERINAALLSEIDERRALDPGVTRSNRAGWHSESDFFRRTEPAHAELSKAITNAVGDATGRLSQGKMLGTLQIQLSGWINVNPPTAYNVPHDHPGSFWSGCYYVRTQRPADKQNEGGAITFIDPRCAPAGQPLVKAPVFHGSHSFHPKPGSLLLFPSNAKHWVHPNSSDEERVTMAFNAFVLGKKAQPAA
jgi:uncharacterized protein (TIGR02466 family)